MNDYKISQLGIDFIKREEGLRLKAYRDTVGVYTIGYGHTGLDVKSGQVISEERAEELLRLDVAKCEKSINAHVKKPLNQHQVDALCSFIFNVGVGGFEGSTLLKVINVSPIDEGIAEQFNRWNKGTVDNKKVVLPVLAARRKREAALFFL